MRLEPDGAGKVKAKEVYFGRELKNHHGGVVLVGEHIDGFSDSTLRCIEWKTGKDTWTSRSVGKGSLVFANGCLYILGEDGKVGLAEANPKEYRELSSFEVEHGKQKAWAHPVVAGGRLYIRTQDRLRCFDVADGARTGNGLWAPFRSASRDPRDAETARRRAYRGRGFLGPVSVGEPRPA